MSDPSPSKILVIFYSRYGLTERLAILLAEGAIQGEANIRLRRCRDLMPEDIIAADPTWLAARNRMHDEFAAPRIQDVAWADLIAFGTPAAPAATSAELAATLAHIALELPPQTLAGKAATAFTSTYAPAPGAQLAVHHLQSRLLHLGFTTLPFHPRPAVPLDDYESARTHGRLAAYLGRRLHQ